MDRRAVLFVCPGAHGIRLQPLSTGPGRCVDPACDGGAGGGLGQGDIPAFMAGYADDICFIGMSGRTCGKEKVKANYQEHYPDRAAMGDLRFGIHEVVMAGTGHAWATGTWELIRTADTLGGGFSLLWRRDANGWRIIRDHTYRHAILAGT